MHKALLLLSVFSSSLVCGQVNLVLNPSFEDTLDSNNNTVYPLCVDWWNPNEASSDYFTPFEPELSANGNGGGGLYPVPCNGLGCMEAQDGQAYIGLVIYESTNVTKDYAQGFLSEPLLAGTVYCVSAWIAMADTSGLQSCDFQVAFTSSLVYDTESGGSLNLSNYVDFDISGINGDDWTLFESTFTALGGEQYIYLGSNTPNADLACVVPFSNSWLWNTAYILVDNVSVSINANCTVPSVAETSTFPGFQLFPNPSGGQFRVEFGTGEVARMRVMDSKGTLVLADTNVTSGTKIDAGQLAPGIYVVEVRTPSGVRRVRLLIEP